MESDNRYCPIHQSPDALAAQWIMRFMPLLPMFAAQWFLNVLWDIVINTMYERRVYRSISELSATTRILDILSRLQWTLRIGGELLDKHIVPNTLISATGIFAKSVVTTMPLGREVDAVVTVWRPRWLPDLMPDPTPAPTPELGNTIKVLERRNNSSDSAPKYDLIKELVLPPMGLPLDVATNARVVADLIAKTFHEKGCCASVYVMHGGPGVGKSTAVRIVAHLLHAVLYPDYNPTSPGDCLNKMITDYCCHHQTPLVVAYEECDISLQRIRDDTVVPHDRFLLDATDKATWSKLIDRIKRRTNVVLIMTTNRSYEQFQELADADRSMFRRGRVDAHFIWTDGVPEVRKPIDHGVN